MRSQPTVSRLQKIRALQQEKVPGEDTRMKPSPSAGMLHASCLVMSTCPDELPARRLAATLVEERLAACVHVLPAGHSWYRWEGRVEESTEFTLLIKTTDAAYAALEKRLQALHPYELPEVIALSITGGLPGYLEWLRTEVDAGPYLA